MATHELSEELVSLEQNLQGADAATSRALLEQFFTRDAVTNDRLGGFISLVQECEARLEFRASKLERMALRIEKEKATIAAMKQAIMDFLRAQECRAMQAGEHKLMLTANGAPPVIVDTELLPRRFWVEAVTAKPDLNAVRRALTAGNDVPGASLGERREVLRIA